MDRVAGVNVTEDCTGRVRGSKVEQRRVLHLAASHAYLRPRHPSLPHRRTNADRGWGWTPKRVGGQERGGGV